MGGEKGYNIAPMGMPKMVSFRAFNTQYGFLGIYKTAKKAYLNFNVLPIEFPSANLHVRDGSMLMLKTSYLCTCERCKKNSTRKLPGNQLTLFTIISATDHTFEVILCTQVKLSRLG